MFTNRRIPFVVIATIMGIAGCSDSIATDPEPLPPPVPVVVGPACEVFIDGSVGAPLFRTVTPQSTDPAINIALDDHLLWVPPSSRINKLVVFLASSRAAPSTAKIFQEEAARLGYHVIGLAYPNNPGLASFCPQSADPEACYENVRLQIITGTPQTNFVQVNRANSIENRLVKLLVYLDKTYPGEGWGQFLSG
jgi:hypothetical protein